MSGFPVNGSPEEIRKYCSSKFAKWDKVFLYNSVPEEIIFEFQKSIFKSKRDKRCEEIVDMFIRDNKQISDELFILIESMSNESREFSLERVFDYYSYVSRNNIKLSYKNSGLIFDAIRNKPITVQFINDVFGLDFSPCSVSTAMWVRLNQEKKAPLDPEVREVFINHLRKHYKGYIRDAWMYGKDKKSNFLYTPEEYVGQVDASNIIGFFDGNTHDGGEILDSMYNTPEIIEITVNKIVEWINTQAFKPIPYNGWKKTRELIKNHEKFTEIESIVSSPFERMLTDGCSWEEIDTLVESTNLDHKSLRVIFSRVDAPLWFTDKYLSKITQLMYIEQSSHSGLVGRFYSGFVK